ncbi:PfkB family carbohydrate kinase [Streptomyces sp. NPDC001435]|uniref:PfkB family carbohydrate kinase n=1 Tax=unclassified Streptomyces TaxID=2593676 RepID=UPI0036913AA3
MTPLVRSAQIGAREACRPRRDTQPADATSNGFASVRPEQGFPARVATSPTFCRSARRSGTALACPDGERVRVPAVTTPVVDAVGAGDSFTAGLLHHIGTRELLGGQLVGVGVDDVAQARRFATRAAALTCRLVGSGGLANWLVKPGSPWLHLPVVLTAVGGLPGQDRGTPAPPTTWWRRWAPATESRTRACTRTRFRATTGTRPPSSSRSSSGTARASCGRGR